MPTVGENITNGAKWTGLSSGINAVVKLIQVAVLAHLLAPDAFGLIAIAYIFLTLGDVIVDMGLTTAILHFNSIKARQYSSIFWVNLILGFIVSGIIFAFSNLIADYYNNIEVCGIIRWLSVNIFIISISRLHKTFIQKEMCFKQMAQIEIYGSVIMCVSAIFLALMDFGVYSLVYSTLLSSSVISLLFLISTSRLNRQIKFYISLNDIRRFYSIGMYQFLSSIIEFFSRETDTIFISSFFTAELLGYYTLCKQLTQRIYGVINPIIVKVAVPSLAVIQDDRNHVSSYFEKMISSASYINFYIYSALAVSAYMVLNYLYGESYDEYCWLIYIFSFYYALQSIGSFTGILNIVFGQTKISLIWSIYRVSVMLGVCYVISSLRFSYYVLMITIGVQMLNFYPGFRLTIHKFIPMKFSTYIGAMVSPLLCGVILSILTIWCLNGVEKAWLNGVIGILVLTVSYYLFTYYTKRDIIFLFVRMIASIKRY